jgi:hypothetical protein
LETLLDTALLMLDANEVAELIADPAAPVALVKAEPPAAVPLE